MRRVEAFGVPRLVCPGCDRPVEPSTAVDGQVVCAGCLRRLDLVALAVELAALLEPPVGEDAETGAGLRLVRFDLSDVEREVLDLLLQGYRVSQIAVRTGASIATVRKRLRRVLTKTGTRSQAELVARCRRRGAERDDAPDAQPDVAPGVVVALDAQPAPSGAPRRSRRPRT
jgi:DNA-binding CsgD family transcriptional regulator